MNLTETILDQSILIISKLVTNKNNLEAENKKLKGQLDILCRTLNGEDESSIAKDYDGLHYEDEPAIMAARKRILQFYSMLGMALEIGLELANAPNQRKSEQSDRGSSDQATDQSGTLPVTQSSGQDETAIYEIEYPHCTCWAGDPWDEPKQSHAAHCPRHEHIWYCAGRPTYQYCATFDCKAIKKATA